MPEDAFLGVRGPPGLCGLPTKKAAAAAAAYISGPGSFCRCSSETFVDTVVCVCACVCTYTCAPEDTQSSLSVEIAKEIESL